jgi:hypothetical protein
MRETKTFASLSSGLLARKGGAKPAMRPQGFNSYGGSLEDLGWDDMGHGDEAPVEHVPSSVAALTPPPAVPRAIHPAAPEPEAEPAPVPAPPAVIEQQNSLRESFAEPAEPVEPAETAEAAKAEVVELPRRRALPLGAKPKAAFTLRLDPARHLRLRLASAITRRSAQNLVTAALDDFLDSLPELEELAERVPAEAGQRSR